MVVFYSAFAVSLAVPVVYIVPLHARGASIVVAASASFVSDVGGHDVVDGVVVLADTAAAVLGVSVNFCRWPCL